MNDVCRAAKTAHREGSFLCSAPPIFSKETDLGTVADKRTFYALVGEWESKHEQFVRKRVNDSKGCRELVKGYMKRLKRYMNGTEF